MLIPLTVFYDTTLHGPLVWPDTAVLMRLSSVTEGQNLPIQILPWNRYTTDVPLNTNLSPQNFILLLSLKYMKLTAAVVLRIINMSSSLGRGLQHFLVFSSHINSTWWKAVEIIKCVFHPLFSFSASMSARRISELEESRFSPQHQPMR